jgi:(E)-4-hydroxy-3-methylbut-2-enyl-diphosphate synthase
MRATRDRTRAIAVGDVPIGGGHPVVVQSMTKTDTRDAAATLAQIARLTAVRCRIVRVAVPDQDAAAALPAIVRESPVPIVADIHFDHRFALAAVGAGVAGLRINPGTIGSRSKVAEVVESCKERQLPIRVGVNAGSLPKDLLARHGGPTAAAMVEAALAQVRLLEDLGHDAIKVSLKASDVARTVAACLAFADASDRPQHVGVTEAGSPLVGAVKSAIGIGRILEAGVGDTVRVSLAGDPVREVKAAHAILRSLGLSEGGVEVIACPTCGRLTADTLAVVDAIEDATASRSARATVAVMGCAVNGPGEGREADVGVVADGGAFRLYKAGRYVRKIATPDVVAAILEALDELEPDGGTDR